jgi:formylglycine-generating enzyme required for sulfatase activity
MGCSPGDSECDDEEKPAHRVTITKGFWIGRTEVTQAAYEHVQVFAARSLDKASLAASRPHDFLQESHTGILAYENVPETLHPPALSDQSRLAGWDP